MIDVLASIKIIDVLTKRTQRISDFCDSNLFAHEHVTVYLLRRARYAGHVVGENFCRPETHPVRECDGYGLP